MTLEERETQLIQTLEEVRTIAETMQQAGEALIDMATLATAAIDSMTAAAPRRGVTYRQ